MSARAFLDPGKQTAQGDLPCGRKRGKKSRTRKAYEQENESDQQSPARFNNRPAVEIAISLGLYAIPRFASCAAVRNFVRFGECNTCLLHIARDLLPKKLRAGRQVFGRPPRSLVRRLAKHELQRPIKDEI